MNILTEFQENVSLEMGVTSRKATLSVWRAPSAHVLGASCTALHAPATRRRGAGDDQPAATPLTYAAGNSFVMKVIRNRNHQMFLTVKMLFTHIL